MGSTERQFRSIRAPPGGVPAACKQRFFGLHDGQLQSGALGRVRDLHLEEKVVENSEYGCLCFGHHETAVFTCIQFPCSMRATIRTEQRKCVSTMKMLAAREISIREVQLPDGMPDRFASHLQA